MRLGGNHESSRFSHNQRNRGPYYSHRCVFSTLRAGFYDDHKLVLFDCVNYGIHDSSRTHVINHTARESADTRPPQMCAHARFRALHRYSIHTRHVTPAASTAHQFDLARPANAPIVRHIPSPPPPRPHTVFRSSAAASARITLTSPGPLTPIARHPPHHPTTVVMRRVLRPSSPPSPHPSAAAPARCSSTH